LDRENREQLVASSNAKGLNDWTALHIAANEGHLEVCEVLIYEGEMTNLEARTSMKRTPLHLASTRGHANVVKLLLREGVDIDAQDNENNTALHYASLHGHLKVAKNLLKKGASVSILNQLEKTPPDLSSTLEIVQLFIQHCRAYGLPIPQSGYSRVPFNNVLMRNSRQDQINRLLQKCAVSPNETQVKKL
jgi:ankyrin repeat protein